MEYSETPYNVVPPLPRDYLPKATVTCAAVCVGLFIAVNLHRDPGSWASLETVGGASAQDVWHGHWWGLLVNNFLHVQLFHIFFNLYWLVLFGRKIEYEQGPGFLVLFIFLASVVSSGGQIAWDGNMGIGLSGVVYALFGYIALADRYDGRYRGFIPARTKQLFIIWLFFCIVVTHFNLFSVGNGAHMGGLIWGALIGFLRGQKSMWGVIPALLVFGLSLVPAFWAPWQLPWLEERAFRLHKQLNLDEALKVYDVILAKYPEDSFAIGNKKVIVDYKVWYLRDTAMTALSNGDFKTSVHYFDKILLLDPKNPEAMTEEAAIRQVWHEDTTAGRH